MAIFGHRLQVLKQLATFSLLLLRYLLPYAGNCEFENQHQGYPLLQLIYLKRLCSLHSALCSPQQKHHLDFARSRRVLKIFPENVIRHAVTYTEKRLRLQSQMQRRDCGCRGVISIAHCGFRSDDSLEAIAKARDERVPNLALYNYLSFSDSFYLLGQDGYFM
ncbi:uncharacterized protein LOC130139936 [Syzygium oleosum]|uniref:uncharacterized protein LOC130139936 n=1 Tax=Syzygium oleosum TaxID=219896 RepID=UPI0024B8C202|nr:uncharacterized protein LOC130139936 [Syzygium oleosum]